MSNDSCHKEREAFKKATKKLADVRQPSVSTKAIGELTPGARKSEAEIHMDAEARQLIAVATEELRKADEALADCQKRHMKPKGRAKRKSH